MQRVLPQNLNYNDVKPVGYPSHVRYEKFTPVAFNTSSSGVSSSDIIRFNISTNGFWDPYSAYIKMEVDVTGMDGVQNLTQATGNTAAGSLQVDNSAHSFIQQLVIQTKGTEIERIEEYDTISAILNDCNSAPDNRASRIFEGMNGQAGITQGFGYTNPNFTSTNGTIFSSFGYNPISLNAPEGNGNANLQLLDYSANFANGYQSRFEYTLLQQNSRDTIQKPGQGVYTQVAINFNNTITSVNSANIIGFSQPYNYSLSCGTNETILTNNFNSNSTYKGALNQTILKNRVTFCFPIVSGLLGILMPKESYKYIPMKSLQELILEFRLSPYAMFTSGYNDPTPNTSNYTVAMTSYKQISRIWKITKFEINVEMQYFEPDIENIILSQLNTDKGIIIHSNSWMLGPRYQIAANTSPSGTYQVNLGFESLKNVIWCYIPDDFTTYTFCRKQYRIGANITQMYIKIGTEYYPPLPITGHAGIPQAYQGQLNDTDLNNSEFLIQLYKVFGKFNDIQTNCLINPINFAVNDRAFDPTKTTSFYNSTTNTAQGYQNMDTAASLPLFHENRCVGRAVYAMNLETLNNDFSVISGINTINNRPFEITLKSDNTNSFSRSYTMYVFCQYDMLIQLRTSGVQILGRG